MGQIAKRYGVTRTEISVANNIADPLKIRAGQDLLIPGGKVSNSPRTTTTPKPAPQLPSPEAAPASSPVGPITAPVEESPIGAAPASAPPEVPVQDVNPIAAPK